MLLVLVGADYWTDWVRCAVAGNTKVQGEVKRSEGQALHTGGGPSLFCSGHRLSEGFSFSEDTSEASSTICDDASLIAPTPVS